MRMSFVHPSPFIDSHIHWENARYLFISSVDQLQRKSGLGELFEYKNFILEAIWAETEA